jgi:hypothetical protein
VIFHCHFYLHLPNDQGSWKPFHKLVSHFYIIFGVYWMSVQVLCLFFIWIIGFMLLSCRSSLYILHTNTVSDLQFVNIFFYSVGFLFILLNVSLMHNFKFWCRLTYTFLLLFSVFFVHFQEILVRSNVL